MIEERFADLVSNAAGGSLSVEITYLVMESAYILSLEYP